MTIQWVLFDADGVVQGVRQGWLEQLTAAGGERGEEFVLAVFAAEAACTTGRDFGAEMQGVLDRFGITAPIEEVLDPQYWIETDSGVLAAAAALRGAGVHTALATNQQNLRGGFMRGLPGFAEAFDQLFFSYELGFAKPDPGYFIAVVDRVRVRPESILFIDDNQVNVDGAREAGLQAELFPRDGGVAALLPILRSYGLPEVART